MKLSAVFLFALSMQVSARAISQTISFSGKNVSLEQVFLEVKKQTGYVVFCTYDILDKTGSVSIDVKDTPLQNFMEEVLRYQSLEFSIENKTIFVRSMAKPAMIIPDVPAIPPIDIRGTITDSAGNPLAGVSIQVKGDSKGTSTDGEGKFILRGVDDDAELQISSIGYVSVTVKVNSRSTINISLGQDIRQEEMVTVSYGVQKRATLSGAIVSAKGSDIRRSPATNFTNNLVGRLPGLTVLTPSGEPGSGGNTVRIRGSNTLGNNSPLIVIDGIANRPMDRINPADVESITVLKDAMAAIYGAQAANGVILITTRRGKSGKPRITLDISQGYNQPTKIPEMANAPEYATMLNEIYFYRNPSGGRNQRYTEEDIRLFGDGSDPWGHPNTDWFGTVFKRWSPQTYVNASMSGGTDNLRYFLSLGGRSEDGYYKNSATKYNQYNFRSNIDGKVSKNLSVSFDVSGRMEVSNFPTVSSVGIFRSLMRGKPDRPAFWPDGSPGPELEFGDQPAVTSTNATGQDRSKWYRLENRLNVNFIVPWVKGLSVQGNASIDKAIQSRHIFGTPWFLYTWDGNPDHVLSKGKKGYDTPQLTQESNDGQNITLNAYATYERTFNQDHHAKIMAGTESQKGDNLFFTASRRNFLSTEIDQLFAGGRDRFMTNDGFSTSNARLNYFGRVNYDYKQKYLLEYVWRYDGSYIFPKDKRFGFFSGVSAGWRISEEKFWRENIRFFDNFKIRGSWGQSGNDRIDEYQFLASFGFQDPTFILGTDQENKRLAELRVPNRNITWEIANQTNIGFEAQFLNNRLTFEADYFLNKRSNILWYRNASVPGSTGMTLPRENIGKVSNRGFELQVGYADRLGDLNYSISVNGSYTKNKIDFWDETPGVPEYQRSTGRPIGSSLYYNAIGIFKDKTAIDGYPHWPGAVAGDIIFEDVNNDGQIDGLDLVRNERNTLPRFVGGLNLSLQYKNFELVALFQGAAGAQQYLHPESGEAGNYYKDFVVNRWTPENPNTSYPRTFDGNNEYWRNQSNTFWLQSTDYIRLKNLELGYRIPLNSGTGIESLRIFVNGLNLFTIDKGTLIDPESEANQLAGQFGIPYPPQRIINGGISITF